MKNVKTNWTVKELETYILLFCTNLNYFSFNNKSNRLGFVKNKKVFNAIRVEFDNDNEYQGIEKIDATLEAFSYSQDEVCRLLMNLKELILSSGKRKFFKEHVFMGLKRILIH
jgi:hypothetical protein